MERPSANFQPILQQLVLNLSLSRDHTLRMFLNLSKRGMVTTEGRTLPSQMCKAEDARAKKRRRHDGDPFFSFQLRERPNRALLPLCAIVSSWVTWDCLGVFFCV